MQGPLSTQHLQQGVIAGYFLWCLKNRFREPLSLSLNKWHNMLAKLASMGRMALTNYIMPSIILSSVFYGYAGGLYDEISRAPQILIVFAIVAIQIPLSSWWLKHYPFGQLEWSWRSLTYQTRQPFRVIPS
jgi:uncharacterized protein